MSKGPIALIGAAFLSVALGGCSEDNVLHSCHEGLRSAKVIADREDIKGQIRPVVSVLLFLRQGNIGSGASRKPIYEAVKSRPTPAEINDKVAVAEAYCVNGTIPKPD